MKITLPWPDVRLTPNAKRRKHWRTYQPAIKADRAAGHALTCCALSLAQKRAVAAYEGKIALSVTFFPPDRRLRDDDGMISAFKHLRDGMADALGVDDHRFRATYAFADAEKPGRVEVTIEDRFGDKFSAQAALNTLNKNGPDECGNTVPGPDRERIGGAP